MTDYAERYGRERLRINMSEQYEVNYWAHRLGVTVLELMDAVSAVGNCAENVKEHLHPSTTQAGQAALQNP